MYPSHGSVPFAQCLNSSCYRSNRSRGFFHRCRKHITSQTSAGSPIIHSCVLINGPTRLVPEHSVSVRQERPPRLHRLGLARHPHKLRVLPGGPADELLLPLNGGRSAPQVRLSCTCYTTRKGYAYETRGRPSLDLEGRTQQKHDNKRASVLQYTCWSRIDRLLCGEASNSTGAFVRRVYSSNSRAPTPMSREVRLRLAPPNRLSTAWSTLFPFDQAATCALFRGSYQLSRREREQNAVSALRPMS